MFDEELRHHIRSYSRFVYYVTDEEDRFLQKLQQNLPEDVHQKIKVFNLAHGLISLNDLLLDWKTREHKTSPKVQDGINGALIEIYKDTPQAKSPKDPSQGMYVITDPARWLSDQTVVRRLVNLAHQIHNDETILKMIFFVGPRLAIPQALQRYIEVVHDKGLGDEEIQALLEDLSHKLTLAAPVTPDLVKAFRGLTSYEVEASVSQSVIQTKRDPVDPSRIDLKLINGYKVRQLRKTDLIGYVETSKCTFDQVGGVHRFKKWVKTTRSTWTPEGRKFGLTPPKGVLLVGVWGCGKSISAKALGSAWDLPVVQLELGKLRNAAIGESEANTYRAISMIEAQAPCIVWVDEAEKTFSGSGSSAQSDAGLTARMIGILSTWLQETKKEVCLVMTANSIGTLPIEFVRRCDDRFFFDLPSPDERIEVIKIHLKNRGQDPGKFNLARLSEDSRQMVGSEIEQAINSAMTESFMANKSSLDEEILSHEFQKKPRIFKTLADELKQMVEWVGYDPDVKDGIRARLASDREVDFSVYMGADV